MFILVTILLCTSLADAKILDRCELARQLKNAFITENDLYKWVCIGQQSGLDTSRHLNANGVGSYGIFQISDEYWCTKSGPAKMCGISCHNLLDDDIRDDIQCALKIFNEHKRLNGDGFSAWVPYMPNCRNPDMSYLRDCRLDNQDIFDIIDVRFGDDDDRPTDGANKIVTASKK
ncbi:Lysozyme c-1 [Pseudolycoriella hygida]|uniref:lysozyme n=1 Tax=Pseudolycoriella hygida TaxID=35572 RepID=A0A9Q0N0Y6_9DIPT|nr:Lysozyme c-1 [Pseudolycoriella hygida]